MAAACYFIALTLITNLVLINNVDAFEVLNNAVNFVKSVGVLMDDVIKGAEGVLENIRTLESVIAEAIEEDCEFTCRNGETPKPNPLYAPEPNGCGSLGYQLEKDYLPLEQLSKCCDKHDTCYDTCNEEKEDCDKKFKKCLYSICEKNKKKIGETLLKQCKVSAKLLFTGTITLGCKSYKDAQAKACLCDKGLHHGDL